MNAGIRLQNAPLHFPAMLYRIIETEDPSIVSWELDGRSFRFKDYKRFCSEIAPKYFKGMTSERWSDCVWCHMFIV
jgi:hypothetical protein